MSAVMYDLVVDGKVTCALCSRKFAQITHTHLRGAHNTTLDEYIEMFPSAVICSNVVQSPEEKRAQKQAYMSEYNLRYNKEHVEEIAEYNLRYNKEHAEDIAEYNRLWNEDNREKIAEHHRQYNQANKEKIAEQQRQYYLDNKEVILERIRRYQQEHGEEIAIYAQQYHLEHKEERAEYNRLYAEAHPEVFLNAGRKRRAAKLGANGNFTDEEFQLLCEAFKNRCIYCHLELPLTADHMIPLSRGGSDNIDNIVPACKSCNSRKYTKTYDEFIEQLVGVNNAGNV